MQRVLHYDPIVEAQPLLSKLTRIWLSTLL